MKVPFRRGFTLIELLIVVAIIAILAAIAVPNFLEAQVRSKVSRVKNDHRALATALEAYYMDNNDYYPPYLTTAQGLGPFARAYIHLSTPVAYISNALLRDPFGNDETLAAGGEIYYQTFNYHGFNNTPAGLAVLSAFPWWIGAVEARWFVGSNGPTRIYKTQECILRGEGQCTIKFTAELVAGTDRYDPTNGTISRGMITRTHKGINEGTILALIPVTGPFFGF